MTRPTFFSLHLLLLTGSFAFTSYAHAQCTAACNTLEIIQPKAGLSTTNRFYKAYPGLEYNVRMAVIGGAYPYIYSLTTAPNGMTITPTPGRSSGRIRPRVARHIQSRHK